MKRLFYYCLVIVLYSEIVFTKEKTSEQYTSKSRSTLKQDLASHASSLLRNSTKVIGKLGRRALTLEGDHAQEEINNEKRLLCSLSRTQERTTDILEDLVESGSLLKKRTKKELAECSEIVRLLDQSCQSFIADKSKDTTFASRLEKSLSNLNQTAVFKAA